MLILLIIVVSVLAVSLGRFLMGRWFNHLSLYSLAWGVVLVLQESQLLKTFSLSSLAWTYIFAAWGSLFLGSWMFLPVNHARPKVSAPSADPILMRRLRKAIYLFSLLGIVALVTQALSVMHQFGDLADAIFVNANTLYLARIDNPELGGISYLGTFAPAACVLAGVYTAKIGKLSVAGLLPPFIVVLSGVLAMGRAPMIFAGILFVTAFSLTPRPKFRLNKGIATAVIFVVPLLGIWFVSSTRGLGTGLSDLSPIMSSITDVVPEAESAVFDFTSPVVGFSEYLKHPEDRGAFVGRYTFAPIFRGLSQLGLNTPVPRYEEFYPTPTEVNVMTWLKNIHSDFGPLGIFFFPYLVGAAMTWLTVRLGNLMHIALSAHGYLVILFSIFYNPMLLGSWYLGLALTVIATFWIQRKPQFAVVPVKIRAPKTTPMKRLRNDVLGDILFSFMLVAPVAAVCLGIWLTLN